MDDKNHPVSFNCGSSRNLGNVVDMFDAVFVPDHYAESLRVRLTENFGGQPEEPTFVLQLLATRKDIPLDSVAIDGSLHLPHATDKILAIRG